MRIHVFTKPILVCAAISMTCALGTPVQSYADAPERHSMRVEQNDESFTVFHQGQRVFRYRIAPNPYKGYVDYLVTPSGRNLLRDAPADHVHHHGLMFAVRADDVNFWEERDEPGAQVNQGHVRQSAAQRGERVTARFGHRLHWLAPDDEAPILVEERDLALRTAANEDEPTLLTWRSSFTVGEGREAIEISGAHYHGLGARFLAEMDEDGAFVTPSGEPEHVRGSEYLVRAPWQAYQSQAEGAPVTFAMFCHPNNYRHPAWWFQMDDPFAYLSATMYVHEEPFELTAGEEPLLTYGVALWDGHLGAAEIQAAYDQWLAAEHEN